VYASTTFDLVVTLNFDLLTSISHQLIICPQLHHTCKSYEIPLEQFTKYCT